MQPSEHDWHRVPILQKIAAYAREAGIIAGPHYLTYGLHNVKLSTKTIVLDDKLCRISAPHHIKRTGGTTGIRRLQAKKPTPEVLSRHEFLVVLVDIDLPDLKVQEIYCVPREVIRRLPTTSQRIIWIPLERARGETTERYLDWSQYAGLRGLQLIKGTATAPLSLTKEQWLDQPAANLGTGTLPDESIREMASIANIKLGLELATVRQLLSISFGLGHRRFLKTHALRLHNTRTRLRELGFGSKDGPFLRAGTKRYLVEDVMRTCSLDRGRATLVVDSAHQMGWGGASWEREE